jgi:multidrug efflux pump subunit AcrA (membrane-fusion protein)
MTMRIPKTANRNLLRSAGAMALLWIVAFSAAFVIRADESGGRPLVRKGDFQPTLVLTGSLKALQSEELKVPVTDNWRIQIKWMAKEGDSVKPGDPVVRFDTATLASDIETSQDSLRIKAEEKAQKEADYRHQKFELEVEVQTAENDTRQKKIDASVLEELVSKYEYERKQLEKKKSDYSLESARTKKIVNLLETEASIKTLGIEATDLQIKLEKMRQTLDSLTLKAHAAGTVVYAVDSWTGRKIQVGDTVYATRTVAQIPDPSSLQVQAWISETHIQKIRAGQKAELYLDAYPDKRYRGVVAGVSTYAEQVRRWGRSNYFRVDIDIENLDRDIMKPEMSVKCDIHGPLQKNVLLIPLEMTNFDGRDFWIRPDSGKARKLAVLGFNDFHLAASPEANPDIKVGAALWPVEVPQDKKETKAGEK